MTLNEKALRLTSFQDFKFDQILDSVILNVYTQWHLLKPPGNKPFENTVGKGEIARNEQFLLFPQCFLPV